MRMTDRSPKVTHVYWGRMEVEGLGSGKDFKLYPGGGREWDWAETGMRHSPGIRPADVDELLESGATVIVLSQGMERRLETDPSTFDLLSKHGVAVHQAETKEAVRIYNELAKTESVGGLFHSTC